MGNETEFAAAVVAGAERLDRERPDPVRRIALERLRITGLPSGRKLETWKYTPISAFYRNEIAGHGATASALVVDAQGDEADGVAVTRAPSTQSDVEAACAQFPKHPLAAVTAALADEVVTIDVAPGAVVEIPIHVSTRVGPDTGRCSRLTVRIARGARVALRERHAANAAGFQWVHIEVGPEATLDHQRVEEPGQVPCWSLVTVDVDTNASYAGALYAFAAAPRRTDLNVQLRGDGARADLLGASAATGTESLDLAVVVEHRGARTFCRQRFHGIAGGRSTLTFNGRIEIHAAAHGADAALTSRNLLLTPTARVNAKPELEINNRDVRCSHGATVGQLDPAQIFYLRSRGIDLAGARALLLRAFVAQCLTPAALESGLDHAFATFLGVSPT
jgi:Fe-S cluster assembly protein SufD